MAQEELLNVTDVRINLYLGYSSNNGSNRLQINATTKSKYLYQSFIIPILFLEVIYCESCFKKRYIERTDTEYNYYKIEYFCISDELIGNVIGQYKPSSTISTLSFVIMGSYNG